MPAPTDILTNLDDYGAWVAAVVAGLGALGWLGRRTWRVCRAVRRRALELGRKIDALELVAVRELDGDAGSTREHARQAAQIALALEDLQRRMANLEPLEGRVTALEKWRQDVEAWRRSRTA